MDRHRVKLKSNDEYDWVSRKWRYSLCVFKNTTGLGKKVKRALNKRARVKCKKELAESIQ